MDISPDPDHVVLAGDWHGNTAWVCNYAIPVAAQALTERAASRRILIQLGDFGFSPATYQPDMQALDSSLAEHDMELWWIDGNHEEWPAIQELVRTGIRTEEPPEAVKLWDSSRITYLPRGTRWTWHGKTWLAVGGAVSVDRLLRKEGVSWFPDEEITEEDAERIIRGGPADVLLAHDVPLCWFPQGLSAPAAAWEPMLPLAHEHSRRLERIAFATGVTRVFHGHYHVWQNDWHGDVRVVGLPEDGRDRNVVLISAREP